MAGSCLFKRGRISASKKHVYFVKALCCRHFSTGEQSRNDKNPMIDQKLLDILVCPLSKKPLRYNSSTSELISDEIGVTFAFKNGIPNLMPNDGRLLRKNNANTSETDCSKDK